MKINLKKKLLVTSLFLGIAGASLLPVSAISSRVDNLLNNWDAALSKLETKDYYEKDSELKEAVDFIVSKKMQKLGDKAMLTRLYNELLNKDWFMTFPDYRAYVAAKEKAYADYENREEWAKKMLVNISKAGFFSSDRTISQYNDEIWHLSEGTK